MTKILRDARSMSGSDWLLLILLSIVWGGSFFFAKIAVAELPPLTIVLARVAIAAAALHVLLRVLGLRMPGDPSLWRDFLLMGLLNNAIPFSLIFWGQQEIASGLASTSVGAYAGAEIMHGLLRIRVPLLARRLVTLIPALVILAIGFDPTLALVLSQVVLSFGIPFALIPLVALTAKSEVLGRFRSHPATTAAGIAASVFLIALNATLLWLVFTGA